MRLAVRIGLGLLGLGVGVLAVVALREATLSTHQPVDPDSRDEIVLVAWTRGTERTQSVAEVVEALVLTCRLEVNSDVAEPLELTDLGDRHRFRVVLAPSLDQTNRRQFRGCVEDWTIDQVRADVVSITSSGTSPGNG